MAYRIETNSESYFKYSAMRPVGEALGEILRTFQGKLAEIGDPVPQVRAKDIDQAAKDLCTQSAALGVDLLSGVEALTRGDIAVAKNVAELIDATEAEQAKRANVVDTTTVAKHH